MAKNGELLSANIYNPGSWYSSSASALLPLFATSPSFASQHVSKKLSAILTPEIHISLRNSGYVMCLQILNGFHRHIVPLKTIVKWFKTIHCKYLMQFTIDKYCTSFHLYLYIICVYIRNYMDIHVKTKGDFYTLARYCIKV